MDAPDALACWPGHPTRTERCGSRQQRSARRSNVPIAERTEQIQAALEGPALRHPPAVQAAFAAITAAEINVITTRKTQMLMQLELVADELTTADLDQLLDLPTRDTYGNDQSAGMLPFFEFIQQQYPDRISREMMNWITENK